MIQNNLENDKSVTVHLVRQEGTHIFTKSSFENMYSKIGFW